jgi:hypothetical protein
MLTPTQQQVKEGIDAVIVDSVLAIRKGLQQNELSTSSTSSTSSTTGRALNPVNGNVPVAASVTKVVATNGAVEGGLVNGAKKVVISAVK